MPNTIAGITLRKKAATTGCQPIKAPAIIISASGMCEAGRVLHHLKGAIESDKNCVLIVGFQAQHTLGRAMVVAWYEATDN